MKKILSNIKTIFAKSGFFIYKFFSKAKSLKAANKRREFILNILLLTMLVLNIIYFTLSFIYFVFTPEQHYVNLLFIFIISLLFAFLLYLSSKGFHKIVIYIFLLLFFLLIIYNSRQWGTNTPQILLSSVLLIIVIISCLYNRDLKKSLNKSKTIVEERTQELKTAQLQIMTDLYKSAEFGKLASGLMHNTLNQLNALVLNIEALKNLEDKEQNRVFLQGALQSTKKLMKYSQAVHKQLRHKGHTENFDINNEINDVIQILDYKAKQFNLEIKNLITEENSLYGNTLKFNQIITTLLSNAIDAYENYDSNKKIIEIRLRKEKANYILSCEDWGKGIAKKNINKIFDQFFTTKKMYKGTGIGLANIKKIIENDFHGKIKVQSTKNFGTTFILKIPIKQYECKTNS